MDRRSALSLIASSLVPLGTAACGFRPLHGSTAGGPAVSTALASVTIPEPESRLSQIIRNDLLSAIRPVGREQPDRYSLSLVTRMQEVNAIDLPDRGAVRRMVRLNVAFRLVGLEKGDEVYAGKTFSQASYDETGQSFADLQAKTNAVERAAKEASLDIRQRLAAHFAAS